MEADSGSVNQTFVLFQPMTGVRSRGGVVGRLHMTPNHAGHAYDDGTRRTEILQTAALLIATSGLRTSLQEIADASGILPGSLYHHFESKEALLVELLRRYHSDLDRIAARALTRLDEPDSRSAFDRIVDLSSAIAQCAVTHRAALQMTFYEGPSSNPELTALARQRPTAILEAMLQTLRAARWSGYVRSDVDLPVLADRERPDDAAGRTRRSFGTTPAPTSWRRCCAGFCWRGWPLSRRPTPNSTGPQRSSPPTKSCRRGSTTAKPRPTTRPRMSVPSPEPSSAAKATKSRPSGTSPRPPEWAPARCTA